MRRIASILCIGTVLAFGSDLYTDTYMWQTGIVKRHVDTGVPNAVSIERLKQKKLHGLVSLYFDRDGLTPRSKERLDALVKRAKARGKDFTLSVIGHSASYTDGNHFVTLDPWSEFWQNISMNKTTERDLETVVNGRIRAVYDYLQKEGVPLTNLYNENRMDRDPLSTEATAEGRRRNDRVDVGLWY